VFDLTNLDSLCVLDDRTGCRIDSTLHPLKRSASVVQAQCIRAFKREHQFFVLTVFPVLRMILTSVFATFLPKATVLLAARVLQPWTERFASYLVNVESVPCTFEQDPKMSPTHYSCLIHTL
jgi:hypothetical protein